MNQNVSMPGNALPFPQDSCGPPIDGAEEAQIVTAVALQALLLIALSHVLQLLLSRLGQPSAISQMLAGMILGPSGLGGVKAMSAWIPSPDMNRSFMSSLAAMGRQLFMFLAGLEMDIPYLLRSGRNASAVALGAAAVSTAMAGIMSPLVYRLFDIFGSFPAFTGALMLVFASTSSPLLIRMSAELKLNNSEVGRLAVSASLVNDLVCILLLAVASTFANSYGASVGELLVRGIVAAGIMALSLWVVRPIVRWLNRRNKLRRHINASEVIAVVLYVCAVSSATEVMGYSSMMTCFLMGLLFPREGGTARTLVEWLSYPVHNLVLPIYFGYNAMQVDGAYIRGRFVWGLFTVVVSSTLAKVAGAVAAAQYLNISLYGGLVLGFLLNVKGHVDIILISMAWKHGLFPVEASMALLARVVVNALIAGPVAALVVRSERKTLKYSAMGLEWQKPEGELRMLACVHGPRELPTFLNLIEIASGTEKTPIAAYMIHLVELTTKTTTAMLYHQQEDDYGLDEEDFGADQARQINVAVDAFTHENGITIRQVTAVSTFSTMHEDVCNGAEDVQASLVLLPFHKFQRVDGKMIAGKEGVRKVNAKVLAHAPCTVGLLVDRGFGGATQVSASKLSHQVLAIFFGGPDDREAVAFGSRLAMHPCVSLTVARFLPASQASYEVGVKMQTSKDEEVLMSIANLTKEGQADEAFFSSFYTRFVASGMVTYAEKLVESSAETVAALREMDGMYSLFLVGRGRRSLSPLVMGLSEWVECPELGPVGDLLASSDFTVHGSVLVLQQHGLSKKGEQNSVRRGDS